MLSTNHFSKGGAQMFYLGVDQHKKYSQIGVINEQGNRVMSCRLGNTKEGFKSLITRLNQPCKSVLEAGYSWGIVYDILNELGTQPTLAHALKVKAIAAAKIKTDTIDSYTLADLLRANLIPPVYVPTKEVRHQKDILRQRCWLVKLRTMIKNRIHQILARNHIQPGFSDLFGIAGRKYLNSITLKQPDENLLRQHLSA